jgi:hypothetical protein
MKRFSIFGSFCFALLLLFSQCAGPKNQGSTTLSQNTNLDSMNSFSSNLSADLSKNSSTVTDSFSNPRAPHTKNTNRYYKGTVLIEGRADTIPFTLSILRDSSVGLYKWGNSPASVALFHDMRRHALWLQNNPPHGPFRRLPVHKFANPIKNLPFSTHELLPLWTSFFREDTLADTVNFFPKNSSYVPFANQTPCKTYTSPEKRFPYTTLKICPSEFGNNKWTLSGKKQLDGFTKDDSTKLFWNTFSKRKFEFNLERQANDSSLIQNNFKMPWESLEFLEK